MALLPGWESYAPGSAVLLCSTNKAQTAYSDVEDKERIDGNADAIPDDSRAPQNTDASSQRPRDKDNIYRYPCNRGKAQCTEKSGNDQGEQRVADNTD